MEATQRRPALADLRPARAPRGRRAAPACRRGDVVASDQLRRAVASPPKQARTCGASRLSPLVPSESQRGAVRDACIRPTAGTVSRDRSSCGDSLAEDGRCGRARDERRAHASLLGRSCLQGSWGGQCDPVLGCREGPVQPLHVTHDGRDLVTFGSTPSSSFAAPTAADEH
jgi:hypothetical protein